MTEKDVEKRKQLSENDEEYVLVPPDGGWGWFVTFSGFLALAITDGINMSFGLVLNELSNLYENESISKISWVFSILIGIQMLIGPLVSALSNRFGYRPVVIFGSCLGMIGLSASFFAPTVDVLFLTIGVLCGFAFCMVWMPCMIAVGFYFEKRRALTTGIVMCGTGVGIFIFAPLVTLLLEVFGMKGTFLIMGAIYFNCAICGSVIRPVKLKRKKKNIDKDMQDSDETKESMLPNPKKSGSFNYDEDSEASKGVQQSNLNQITAKKKTGESLNDIFKFSLFRSPAFVLLCISSFFQLLGMLVPYMFLASHAMEAGISKEAAAFLLSIIGIVGTVAKIFWGMLADHPKISTLLLNNLAMSFCGILIMLVPFFTTYEWLVTFSVLLGFTDSCFFVLRPILLGELIGTENVNNGFGFNFLFCGLASFIGLPLTGLLYDTFGSFDIPFYFAGGAVLLSAILCYPLNWINRRWKWEDSSAPTSKISAK